HSSEGLVLPRHCHTPGRRGYPTQAGPAMGSHYGQKCADEECELAESFLPRDYESIHTWLQALSLRYNAVRNHAGIQPFTLLSVISLLHSSSISSRKFDTRMSHFSGVLRLGL